MKKGYIYCTVWTDHIAGIFTYDGKSPIDESLILIGSRDDLYLLQKGFSVMEIATRGSIFDYVERVCHMVSHEVVDKHISICDNDDLINELIVLKKYSSQIQRIISGKR